MKTVDLGEVAEFINGAAFKPNDWGEVGRRIIRIQNLTDPTKPFNRTTRQVASKYDVEPGTLLVSWSASLGVFEWNEPDTALLNQHIFKVVPDVKKIRQDYLRLMLVKALEDMGKYAHGSTMQHVNREEFLGTRIPVPPLDEQKRIAAILDQADEIRLLRQRAVDRLNQLEQAIFYEMFGDPAKNPMEWREGVLGDVVHSVSDGPHVSPEYSDTGIPFLSARHIRPSGVCWEDLKYISSESAGIQWRKCKPEAGDILYTKGGTTGIATVVDFDLEIAIWVHIALLKPNRDLIAPYWLAAMLNSSYCYRQSQTLTHGIGNQDLGLKRMVKIKMFLPPIHLQHKFAERLLRLKTTQLSTAAYLVQTEHLFSSLQHRAFAGEL
ncbi:restriction endonuclease subunit S [Methylocapsa polymorpha]|uniref:Restriction endonuclease subunit S n=1 Tax=Methylocapsa polymorpha TaxID=3080828 RepID=A0ABZ0HNX6_9HYPH|nr:restriction endonuclease subunit S [Methylocapsa sp. RX1]